MRFDRIASSLLGALILLALACVPLRGGWDVDALVSKESAIAALEGQRLGDMLPFPALDGDGIALVACRYVEGQSVRVYGGGPHWPGDWGRTAVRALNRSVEGVELVFEEDGGSIAKSRPSVEIVALEAIGGAGPVGLGDTLSECDVSPIRPASPSATQVGKRAFRGVLVGAEIRMRRAQLDMSGQIREASAEEWVGALMHELAHSLGFAGHVAAGDSILVRDEMKIRAAGRRALDGEAIGNAVVDETLEALYRLRPGQLLGSRTIRVEDLPPYIHRDRGRIEPTGLEPGTTLAEMERELIRRTLEFTGGNRTHGAELLGIGVRTLQRKIRTYELDVPSRRRRPRGLGAS